MCGMDGIMSQNGGRKGRDNTYDNLDSECDEGKGGRNSVQRKN